jgi:hypothetical protein
VTPDPGDFGTKIGAQITKICEAGQAGRVVGVEDLGPPIAYLVLKAGTPVYDRGVQRIGVVEHVLADEAVDIFHGLIIHTLPLPGRHLFADADQIAEIHERGVVLAVGAGDLHEPTEDAAAERAVDDDAVENPLQAALWRAWDWVSQRR